MTSAAVEGRESRRIGILVVGFVGVAQVASIALDLGAPSQPLLSILFVLTCPGFLLFDLEKPSDVSARLLISIGGIQIMNQWTIICDLSVCSKSMILMMMVYLHDMLIL